MIGIPAPQAQVIALDAAGADEIDGWGHGGSNKNNSSRHCQENVANYAIFSLKKLFLHDSPAKSPAA
jgi:hypothetical protein